MAVSTPPHKLKQRVFACLTKLSDRDTHNLAASELEAIARTLEPASFPVFISCIHATDSADKSPVRRQCLNLIAVLSEAHGNTLSPHLSKMLSGVVRRLRDPDSAVRTSCVRAVAAISSHVTKPPFSSLMKPLSDALFTEQDHNAQIGAALCLASAIEASPDPEPAKLGKLLPRLEKLLKSEAFRAKSSLLAVVASAVEAGAAGSHVALKNLVPILVDFLKSQDWAARKAAAEALTKLAFLQRDMVSEFKAGCLKILENRRFDKVKAVREVMNQTLEAWKQVPDLSDEASPPPPSQFSSKDDASDGRYPPGSRFSTRAGCAAQIRKKPFEASRSTPADGSLSTTAKKRSPLKVTDRNTGPAVCGKTNCKNPLDWKVQLAVPRVPSTRHHENDFVERDENVPDRGNGGKFMSRMAETRRTLFSRSSDDKVQRISGFKSGSRVVPCHEESLESAGVGSNVTVDVHRNHKDCEDLSLIRKQLVQIEKQQSSLMDLLQKFIGSSQNGMRSLETRVHGLELALDEISYDLAVSTGRMSTKASRTTCCLLPGADFLSAKFWRKTEGRYSTSKHSNSSGTPFRTAMRCRADRDSIAETFLLENHRFRFHGGNGFIVNPLAEIHGDSIGVSEVAHV